MVHQCQIHCKGLMRLPNNNSSLIHKQAGVVLQRLGQAQFSNLLPPCDLLSITSPYAPDRLPHPRPLPARGEGRERATPLAPSTGQGGGG